MTGGDSAARKEKTLSILLFSTSFLTKQTVHFLISDSLPAYADRIPNKLNLEETRVSQNDQRKPESMCTIAKIWFCRHSYLSFIYHSTEQEEGSHLERDMCFGFTPRTFVISTVTSVSGICDWMKPKPTHYCVSLVPALLPSRLHQQGHSR